MRPFSLLGLTAAVALLAGCGLEKDPPPAYPPEAPPKRPAALLDFRRAPSLPRIAREPDPVLGSPEASHAAHPWWGGAAYAPQPPNMDPRKTMDAPGIDLALDTELAVLSNAGAVFTRGESGERQVGAINGDLVACGVQVTHVATESTTSFPFPLPIPIAERDLVADDVRVTLSFGTFAVPGSAPPPPRPVVKGAPRPLVPEDKADLDVRAPDTHAPSIFWVTAPVAHLSVGDPVTAVLHDTRRPAGQGKALTLRATYEGVMPFRTKEPGAAMECRLVPHARREELIRLALLAVDTETDRLDTRQPGRIFFDDAYPRATERVQFVASLTGWADPRLTLRIARLAQVERQIVADTTAEILEKQAALRRPGTWVEAIPSALSVSVVSLSCGSEAAAWLRAVPDAGESPACILRVRLRNESVLPLDTSAQGDHLAGATWMLADRYGRSVGLRALGAVGTDGSPRKRGPALGPHAEADAIFAVQRRAGRRAIFGGFPPPAETAEADLRSLRPFLLQVSRSPSGWLRVE